MIDCPSRDTNELVSCVYLKISKLTEQLEAREEACALEADGRKLLVSEVNDLNSRLRELEALARADMDRNVDDPVKLKILIGYLLLSPIAVHIFNHLLSCQWV